MTPLPATSLAVSPGEAVSITVGGGGPGEQPLAALVAERRDDVLRHDPEPGIDQADIASRAAPADLACFEQDDRLALARQIQRGGTPCEAATDDGDIGLGVALNNRLTRAAAKNPRDQTPV